MWQGEGHWEAYQAKTQTRPEKSNESSETQRLEGPGLQVLSETHKMKSAGTLNPAATKYRMEWSEEGKGLESKC